MIPRVGTLEYYGGNVPRINDQFLQCVFNLYPTVEDAHSGARLGGTGFFVMVHLESTNERGVVYAVSNRHVVSEAPVLRVNSKDGRVKVFEVNPDQWLFHHEADLAVLPMSSLDNLNLEFAVVPLELFVSNELMQKHNIGPGDDVFMVGRFISHESKSRNTPTVRFGSISMMPIEPISVENMDPQEAFLLEMRSIPGYSGSPTFVYAPPFSNRQDGTGAIDAQSVGPYLLGINFCYLPLPSESKSAGVFRIIVPSENHSGFAGAVPAWRIREMLMLPGLVETRRVLDRQHLASVQKEGPAEP